MTLLDDIMMILGVPTAVDIIIIDIDHDRCCYAKISTQRAAVHVAAKQIKTNVATQMKTK